MKQNERCKFVAPNLFPMQMAIIYFHIICIAFDDHIFYVQWINQIGEKSAVFDWCHWWCGASAHSKILEPKKKCEFTLSQIVFSSNPFDLEHSLFNLLSKSKHSKFKTLGIVWTWNDNDDDNGLIMRNTSLDLFKWKWSFSHFRLILFFRWMKKKNKYL